ncbi:MAG TPA: hypothetical protein VIM24_04500, partial [Candidatus Limnocylindrales bacterium]
HEPVPARSRQDGERLPVTALCLLDEVAIQRPSSHGVRWGRLPTLMSPERSSDFNREKGWLAAGARLTVLASLAVRFGA